MFSNYRYTLHFWSITIFSFFVKLQSFVYKNEGLKTYPNPVKNELKIVVDDLADLSQINIFNSDGKLILSKKIANTGIYHLDLTTLSRGLYFIQIKNKFSKLIKE